MPDDDAWSLWTALATRQKESVALGGFCGLRMCVNPTAHVQRSHLCPISSAAPYLRSACSSVEHAVRSSARNACDLDDTSATFLQSRHANR